LLSPTPVLIDTSTLLNLLASGFPERLLTTLCPQCLISDVVLQESLYLRATDPSLPPERVDLSRLIEFKILTVCYAETPEEEALYVELAAQLDDGEAMSLALSASRGFGLATDDRKATRLANDRGIQSIYGTPEILQACFDLNVSNAIQLIEYRARFSPPSGSPFRDWWLGMRR
jgi:predicted nucleic acid-binding protein